MIARFSFLSAAQKMFIFAVMLTPIAYDVGSLRLNDFCVLIAVVFLLLTNSGVSRDIFLSILVCFLILICSIVIGALVTSEMNVAGLVFFYKYLAIFLVIFLCKDLLSDEIFLQKMVSVYFIVFLLLSVWVYVYVAFVLNGIIEGNFRPSFPLSKDYIESDAHLYSSTLAMMYSAYLLFIRQYLNHGVLTSLAVSALALGAMVLTGSRGGLLMSAMALLLLCMLVAFKVSLTQKLSRGALFFLLLVISFILFVLPFASIFLEIDISKVENLIERAMNFDFSGDESSNLRVEFLRLALADMVQGFYVFGVGPLSSAKVFFDGALSLLLSHGGLSLIMFTFVLVMYLILRIKSNTEFSGQSKLMLVFLVCLYLMSNLITEYIFVMRNMILAITGIAICMFIARRTSRQAV